MKAKDWLLENGYPEFMNMTRGNLEIILDKFVAEKLKQERELRKELYEGLSEIYASTDFSTTISEMIEYLLKKAKDKSHE